VLIVKLRSREHLLTRTYAYRRHGLLKEIPAEHINLNMKMSLKIKINPIREYLGIIIYPIKPSAGLFFLIKSRETIPLRWL
jgi:hypothetical protein